MKVGEDREAELIYRCQQGDQAALREIFDRYHQKVYRIAYGVLRQREDALDVVQEVFIKLFRSIKGFRGKSAFFTYLYRLAMNTAIDHSRRSKKAALISLNEEGGVQLSDGVEKRPDHLAAQRELEGKVKWAIDQLPQDQKATLIYREIEELSYQEIAEVMGCSIGTVMSRLHYGRKKLQELLKDIVKGKENE